MKKIISVLLTVAFLLSITIATTGNDDFLKDGIVLKLKSPVALLNGEIIPIDENNSVVPYIKNDTTLVPLRFVATALGATTVWDDQTKTVTMKKGSDVVRVVIGNPYMEKNQEQITVQEPALLRNDRTLLPLRAISEAFGYSVFFWDDIILISKDAITSPEDAVIDDLNNKLYAIPTVGSPEMLADLLNQSAASPSNLVRESAEKQAFDGAMRAESAPAPSAGSGGNNKSSFSDLASSAESTAAKGSSYSETNTQVQGVDEADVVKTDGDYIYYLKNNLLSIAKINPAQYMELISQTKINTNYSYGDELYVDKNRLVIVSSGDRMVSVPRPVAINDMPTFTEIAPYYGSIQSVAAANVYDITNREEIEHLRTVELDGSLVTSRKIGDSLYFVTTKYAHTYGEIKPYEAEDFIPALKDTAFSENAASVDIKCISYLPDHQGNTFLNVVGFSIHDEKSAVNVESFLGSANDAYVSLNNLYAIGQNYRSYGYAPEKTETVIFKFALEDSKALFQTKGSVPGNVLNQFSMDEHNNYFRIATTAQNEQYQPTNNLFILDENLKITGSILDIAPKESIYSCRFMGDRGYMVTFEKVDPLFVMDLSDPHSPAILGELKIPGYSDYLHPYDENHLIGFGKDTVELPIKSGSGEILDTQAYYLGMKIALFDVTDVNNPIELHAEYIGDRGTVSPILHNHKALLFNKERNLLALPMEVYEVEGDKISPGGYPVYGNPMFKGAYVYQVDLERGFHLAKKITHNGNARNYYEDVERLLYSGDTLFAVSGGKITAHDMKNAYQDIAELNLNK